MTRPHHFNFGNYVIGIFIAASYFGVTPVLADPASNILGYSDNKLLSIATSLANEISKNSPQQVDKITILRGAVFVPQTRTFIYSYETSTQINPTSARLDAIRRTCVDPIKKAFLYRNIVFQHIYATPTSQHILQIKYADCP
jgi:hypothetical protein